MIATVSKAVRFSLRDGTYSEVGGNSFAPAITRVLANEEQSRLERQLQRTTEALLSDRISVAEFEQQLARELKPSLVRMTELGGGGRENLAKSPYRNRQYGAVGAHLRRRYASIANLAEKISKGELTPNQIRDQVHRLSLAVYPAMDRADLLRRQTEQSHNEGYRFLSPNVRHCPSCPAHATNGFVPIEEIVPRGHACLCGGYCHCQIVTRFSAGRAIANLGGQTLADSVLSASKKQRETFDGPSLAEVEALFIKRRGASRAAPVGF